jgi:hypothetical protein
MLHSIFAGIRYCFTKTCAAFVTAAGKLANALTNIGNNIMSMLFEGAAWLTQRFEKIPVKSIGIKACLRQVILLVGGFVCCFIFSEEARGDLTWFEKMLTSSMDWASILLKETTNKITRRFFPGTTEECEVT